MLVVASSPPLLCPIDPSGSPDGSSPFPPPASGLPVPNEELPGRGLPAGSSDVLVVLSGAVVVVEVDVVVVVVVDVDVDVGVDVDVDVDATGVRVPCTMTARTDPDRATGELPPSRSWSTVVTTRRFRRSRSSVLIAGVRSPCETIACN